MSEGLDRKRYLGWLTVSALLVFAAAHAMWRGPVSVKGHKNLCDFASPWASAHLWVTGQNPYDTDRLWPTWTNSPGAFDTSHEFWLALMPPAAYLLLAPLGAMPAGVATLVYLALSAAFVYAIISTVLVLARLRTNSLGGWLLISAALASAPLQTVVSVGQLSLPVMALTLLAVRAARDERALLAGVLLGLAGAIKPQLAAPFFLYMLFFAPRWRVFGVAVAAVILLNLAAAAPMQLRGIPWLADWSRNVALGVAPGAPNDPTSTGPWRNQMIDLRAWLFTITDHRALVMAKALVASLLLAGAYVALLTRARPGSRRLLPLAALVAISLLPVYHRVYDAVLLLLALGWAIRAYTGPLRGPAVATIVALSPLLIPFDLLPLAMKRTDALNGIAQTWVWRVFIFPHYAIATLATTLCLLYAFWRSVRQTAPAREPEATPSDEPELAREMVSSSSRS